MSTPWNVGLKDLAVVCGGGRTMDNPASNTEGQLQVPLTQHLALQPLRCHAFLLFKASSGKQHICIDAVFFEIPNIIYSY